MKGTGVNPRTTEDTTTAVPQPDPVQLDPTAMYVLAIRLIRAYLCDDANETAYHVWWVQQTTGLTDERFAAADREAQDSANNWREAGMVEEICVRIDCQLETLLS